MQTSDRSIFSYTNLDYFSNGTLRTFINIANNPNLADYSIRTLSNQFLVVNNNSNYYFNTINKI